jgi:hypothetical protein
MHARAPGARDRSLAPAPRLAPRTRPGDGRQSPEVAGRDPIRRGLGPVRAQGEESGRRLDRPARSGPRGSFVRDRNRPAQRPRSEEAEEGGIASRAPTSRRSLHFSSRATWSRWPQRLASSAN